MADAKLPDWADEVAFILKQAAIDAQTRGEKYTTSMIAAVLRLHCAPKRKKGSPAAPKPRARNEYFDAMARAFGAEAYTKTYGGLIGKAVAEIREVDPGVTPAEIERRATLIKKKFEGKGGPLAVSRYWHEYGGQRTQTAKRDIYVEPDGRWRQVAATMYPEASEWVTPHDWKTIKWADVSTLLRPDILRKL